MCILTGCGGTKADACGMTLQDSILFNTSDIALTGDLEAARTAALASEGARLQAALFAQKIIAIAKDPAASEQWAKLIKIDSTEARTTAKKTGVAIDLPLQANRLRAAGVPNDEVAKAIDAAVASDVPVDEAATVLEVSATAAEQSGPIEDFGGWTVQQFKLGIRGPVFERMIRDEHKSRGKKAREADEASGEKTTICHRPPGNPNNAKTLEVGPSARAAHLGHGDTEGPCPDGTTKREGKDRDHDDDKGHDKDGDKDKDKDKDGKKVTICHRPPGNPDNAKTMEVGASAVAAHLGHGDTQGPCPAGGAKDKGKDKDKDKGKKK